jgi:hypothetical protein
MVIKKWMSSRDAPLVRKLILAAESTGGKRAINPGL